MSADTKAAAKKASKARLRQELTELNKNPVQGFSAGLIDDDLYNWEVMIIGRTFQGDVNFPGGIPYATTENALHNPDVASKYLREGGGQRGCLHINSGALGSQNQGPMAVLNELFKHPPEKDQFEYESTAERWSPVHTVETIILSVISLLSTYPPNTDSPANVDAARDVNNELQGNNASEAAPIGCPLLTLDRSARSNMNFITLEIDSDSDFNPGAYIPEQPKKRKRDSTRASGDRQKGKRRRDEGGPSANRDLPLEGKRRIQSHEPNPLLEYFAEENLDLHSESEGSDEDPSDMRDEREEEEDEEDDDDDDDDDEPVVSKTFFNHPRQTTSASSPAAVTPLAKDSKVKPDDDGSATEPDSEAEDGVPIIPAHIAALTATSTPLKSQSAPDDSVTEPESDEEPQPIPIPGSTKEDSGSETESDPEYDLADPRLKPRPNFPLREGQMPQGPFYLDDEKKVAIPASINTYLRDYQREGVRFFWKQYAQGRGGLLGDDMGLWGYFEVGMYNGNQKEREPVLRDFKMGRLDVILTTFDLARRDIDILDTLPWTCVFVDEVHRVKNVSSKITMAYHQFLCERRFGLTGTTIQNSYKEMWTILDWTNPGRLGTARQWQGFVVKPLTAGQSAGATPEESAKALVSSSDDSYLKLWLLNHMDGQTVALVLKDKLLPKFFLRRTKDIIRDQVQLPKKTDEVVFCPLTVRQIEVYKQILNMDPVQNLMRRNDICACGSRKMRKNCCGPPVPGDVFKYMSILIKLSNHLALILPSPTDTPDQVVRNRALAELAFPDGDIPKYGTAMMQPKFCGKWAVLEHLLKEWRKDSSNKVLVFTKSVKLLEMLEFHLSAKGMPMIDQFHSDPDIFLFLISTLAGGTGLNLTGANKVVIFERDYAKVALEAYCQFSFTRAFRFGQTRDVSVYRLLGAGSVEELIYARQIYKQQQMAIGYDASVQTRYFEGVQGDATKRGELFGIENIFRLHEDKLATKMAIEKASLAELDWALANMGGDKSKKQAKSNGDDWLANAESKGLKDKEDIGNMKGLGALLFSDAPPVSENREQDGIQKILNSIGVKYSHHNDQIIAPSRIEEERTKKILLNQKTARRRKQKEKLDSPEKNSPKRPWPPIRKHHKPLPTPQEQLSSRHQALVELGMIKHPRDVPAFAQDFSRQTPEMQREILAELDKWISTRDLDSD
ncbi:hypothetical protein H0H92_000200 [Tricholoma furcatifolium]|nr:hypothetical protein H0H92_000200 [Tricholoma furcatifolium]